MEDRPSVELMTQALELLDAALSLIDEAEAPGDIGAHVDLGRERLCRTLWSMREGDQIVKTLFPKPADRQAPAAADEGVGG
jgi:hypothetical protein